MEFFRTNIASLRPATLLTMESFRRSFSSPLINFKIPDHLSSIGGTIDFSECFSMAASEIRRKSEKIRGLSASTVIPVFYACFYISVRFLKIYVYIFVEHFLEDEN